MAYLSDIEIAQANEMEHISAIAKRAGVDEKYITGDASDYEKFRAYCSIMPRLFGNPLYHWSHLGSLGS